MTLRRSKMLQFDTADAIEPLVLRPGVRAWRVGTDYDIEVSEEADPADFRAVVDQLGLNGRYDYSVSYVPEIGLEIYRLTPTAPPPVPAPRSPLLERIAMASIHFENYVMELMARDVAANIALLLPLKILR